MGYYITLRGAHLVISAKNVPAALAAIQSFAADGNLRSVDNDTVLRACVKGDIKAVFDEYSFSVSTPTDTGGIDGIDDYYGEKAFEGMGQFFAIIAPFVDNDYRYENLAPERGGRPGNCFVEFDGEDGDVFRYYFTDGKCYEQQARITISYPDRPDERDLEVA